VVVVLEFKIYVYNFADLKLLDHIETTSNPKGLCCLCPYTPSTVLVCPGMQKGSVRCELYDAGKTTLINAHESSLAALALNSDGTRLATASDRGTLIRIFNTTTGAALQELRRGSDRAEIYSLAFSPTTEWLACSSDKGTIHIFSLSGEKTKGRPKKTTSGKEDTPTISAPQGSTSTANAGSTSSTNGSTQVPSVSEPETTPTNKKSESKVSSPSEDSKSENKDDKESVRKNPTSSLAWASNLLPWVGSEWSFAQYRVPDNSQTIVAFGEEKNSIIVVSADGVFYKAHFDPDKSGTQCQQQMFTKFVKDTTEEQPATTES
jgi:WD40 repeat protein